MTNYWPSWATALALSALTVGYWILLRRPLGVSGVLARFSRIREEREVDRGFDAMAADPAALEAALAAMTAEAFGRCPSRSCAGPRRPSRSPSPRWPLPPGGAVGRDLRPHAALGEHAVFLVAIAPAGPARLAGARLLRREAVGASFSRLVASGPAGLSALAGGGVLVGFGTALCGGCTAGHGLTGCGRLMPGSLVSTAIFFAAAVGVSFLLAGIA